jgi:hypothetical protein
MAVAEGDTIIAAVAARFHLLSSFIEQSLTIAWAVPPSTVFIRLQCSKDGALLRVGAEIGRTPCFVYIGRLV